MPYDRGASAIVTARASIQFSRAATTWTAAPPHPPAPPKICARSGGEIVRLELERGRTRIDGQDAHDPSTLGASRRR
jgi:hypothetical protein